ncbi:unnamed protein product, partial [Scytosiphon promiscuus]
MGGGASSSAAAEQMEEMMAYSVLLSRTITCMSFPGMHSIKDFNILPKKDGSSASVKKDQDGSDRRGSASTSGSFSRSSSGSEGPPPLIGPELEDKFTVVVDGEVIVVDDVTQQARSPQGWTPLHACCHSATTAAVGLRILKEVVALGGDLNLKTKRGPGSFNSGFTPLHMACAYGVAELVEALITAGADVDCRNSFDWGPLQEVCHRGFVAIAASLVRAGADVTHIPDAEASCGAHIMRGAPQSALGLAARGGYKTICKMLLENGGDNDQKNSVGWTPLHEACYFNHLDVAQLLLVHGADPTIKNAQGAMAYNMTGHQPIRDLLREIGGEEAAKAMAPPTFTMCVNDQGQMFLRVTAGEEQSKDGEAGGGAITDGKHDKSSSIVKSTTKGSSPPRSRSPARGAGDGSEANEVLHKGPMLGELPALGKPPGTCVYIAYSSGNFKPLVASRQRIARVRIVCDGLHIRNHDNAADANLGAILAAENSQDASELNSLRMPGATDEGQAPENIICQLSKRVARDPVRTPYGHLFDRQMIALWLSKQGSICPLTGQPLVEAELKADDDVKAEAKAWTQAQLANKKRTGTSGS